MFAAVQQHFQVLEFKGRVSSVLVVCSEGLALSESHFPHPDLSGLLPTSLWVPAGSLPAQGNPTWGAHSSQNHSQGFSLWPHSWGTGLVLWLLHFCFGLFGVSMGHEAETETSGHLRTKTPSPPAHPETK